MSNRLDQEREAKLQPERYAHAVKRLTELGFEVHQVADAYMIFWYKENGITFYPYSGWYQGKGIKGRGLQNLINRIKP